MARRIPDVDCATCPMHETGKSFNFSDELFAILSEKRSSILYKKNDLILTQGSHPSGLLCVYSGRVKIYQTGIRGKEQIFRIAGRGTVLGHQALITNDPLSYSVMAIEDTYVCSLPLENFRNALKANPEFNNFLLNITTSEINQLMETVVKMAQLKVEERLADTLLEFQEKYGITDDDLRSINILLSRKDLSDYVGTAPETTIRLLSEMRNNGVINLVGKRVIINNIEELKRIAKSNSDIISA